MTSSDVQEREAVAEERIGDVCLIADDDEFFRVALKSILLSKLGYSKVIETGSLDEAVDRLSEGDRVAFAIFDLAMPGMGSAASLRAVRECFPDLQVAVVSASKSRNDILLALEAGVHGYVPKGLGVVELCRALGTIRAGSIYVPPTIAELGSPAEAIQASARSKARQTTGSARSLTARQRSVLELLVRGYSNKDIARELNLGEGTIKVHVAALFRSLGVGSRAAAAAAGARLIQSA